jgi:hypothetical protein
MNLLCKAQIIYDESFNIQHVELKRTSYKYIAAYKERIDSLFSYQKKLHEIISTTKKDEVKTRAISELHSIEMDIFNLWKQLPNVDIVEQNQPKSEEQDRVKSPIIVDIEDINGVEEIPEDDKRLWHNWLHCDGCKTYWRGEELLNYHKRKSTNTNCSVPNIA